MLFALFFQDPAFIMTPFPLVMIPGEVLQYPIIRGCAPVLGGFWLVNSENHSVILARFDNTCKCNKI